MGINEEEYNKSLEVNELAEYVIRAIHNGDSSSATIASLIRLVAMVKPQEPTTVKGDIEEIRRDVKTILQAIGER